MVWVRRLSERFSRIESAASWLPEKAGYLALGHPRSAPGTRGERKT